MQRLRSVEPHAADARTKELFAAVESAFGVVPNAVQVMANSPAVLASYLDFAAAMADAGIGDKLQTQVKLAASEKNECEYCSSLLCAIGSQAGLSADDLLAGRKASAEEARTDAALKFAAAVLETGGKVTDRELTAVRAAGFSDSDIVEIVASVVLGSFTNFLNNVARTELDVPQVDPIAA